MPPSNRRLSPKLVSEGVDALNGLKTVTDFISPRPEVSLESLTAAYTAMLSKQEEETAAQTRAKAAADAARQAEWDFYDKIITLREVVKGLYGSDSNAAQAVGLKKKSERKRPTRNGSAPST